MQWAKEAAEAERLEKMLKIENEENAATNDLALVIQNRNKARANQAESFERSSAGSRTGLPSVLMHTAVTMARKIS